MRAALLHTLVTATLLASSASSGAVAESSERSTGAIGVTPRLHASDDAAQLVERTIAVHGGDALPKLGEMMRQQGHTYSASRRSIGAMLREVSWPDYLRVEIDYADGAKESRVMIGQDGWRDGAPISGPMVAAMRLQAARLSLPMLLDWESQHLRDLGPATGEDGAPVRHVAIDLGSDLVLYVEIDARTARIRRSAGVMRMNGAEMDFGAVYREVSDFGGFSWPAREDQTAMGQATGWTIIDSIETDILPSRDALHP